ncbi:MAG: glycosyltransferase family 39 protein [Nanoarchaeota archaeon]|nr:glycosyltransferase family 39 protein [Nanoarchaeota archaeon]
MNNEINQQEDKKDLLEERKEKFLKILKGKKDWLIYIILAFIIWIGFKIRTSNLPLLKDVTTGKYIPLALDPYVFLRYVKYLLENGSLMAIDTIRYYPLGFNQLNEFGVLTHFIVYLYKILHFFNTNITIEAAHVLYPAIAFIIGIIFFFLLIKKLFNYKIALLASTFLIVLPPFLYRTMAGFSDKEALGVMFFFMAFYFYVFAWKSSKPIKNIIFGGLAGIATGMMGAVWGAVNFIFLIIGSFVLIELFLNKFKRSDFYSYISLVICMFITLKILYPLKFNIMNLLTSFTSSIIFLALLTAIINLIFFDLDLFKIKSKLKEKIPLSIISFLITIFIGLIFLIITAGPSFFIDKIQNIYLGLTKPFGTNRWVLTVAEAHQPYIKDWISQFSKKYFWMFLVSSIVLVYEMVKPIKKIAWKFTTIYTLFIIGFIFSRYSQSSKFNGVSNLSQTVYIGSLILFFLIILVFYLYYFYKDKETFNKILKCKKTYIFVLVWFLFMVVGARSAIRLLFIFSPITALLTAYLVFKLVDYSDLLIKNKTFKIIVYIIIALLVISTTYGFYKTVSAQAKYTGPSYNQQWQYAGQWIRESTPEDAVFAHWWDYGYWVQTGGERTTITDGGNAIGPWNYFMGRHVLTAQNETEALEFLKSHDANYLLMISDEIGKYPAYSSIGSDENYDRYSWINTFVLDQNNIQETREETILLYTGGFVLDEDFIYQNKLYPKQAAGIGAIFVPLIIEQNNGTQNIKSINQPNAVVVYNGQQINIPLNCVFFNNQIYKFETDGFDGCLRIIPTINNNQVNPLGAALYLSDRVARTLFAHLYLYGEESESFKIAYNDETNMPLSLYNGRLIGPLKIWEINYPEDIQDNPFYRGFEYPNPLVTAV